MKILIIGKSGMLAQELQASFYATADEVVCQGRPELDLCRPETIREAVLRHEPSLLINAAAYTAVDQAESESDIAFAINRDGVKDLAILSRDFGIPLVHVSTDYVFDGKSPRPYCEGDATAPLGIYGQSKWEGEEAVRQHQPQHIILRTAWLYSCYGRNFFKTILLKTKEGKSLNIVNDQHGAPTWAKDVASALVEIVQTIQDKKEPVWGTYHFCSAGKATWFDFAEAIVEQSHSNGLVPKIPITPILTQEYPTAAKRPTYSVLDCLKLTQVFGIKPFPWRERLQQCLMEVNECPDIVHAQS